MPPNDDMKHQSEEATQESKPSDAAVASVLSDDHAAGADEASIKEGSATPLSSDHRRPQEFTFFQKKKRVGQAALAPA